MGYVILFITLIVLAVYLIAIIIASLPLWGATLIVLFLTVLYMRSLKVIRLNSPKILSRLLQPNINVDRIEWRIIDSEIQSYTDPFGTIVLCITTSTGACWLAADLLRKYKYFHGGKILGQKYPPQTEILVACILTAIVVLWMLYWVKPRNILERAVRRKIRKIMQGLDAKLSGLSELAALEQGIISVSRSWGISFLVNYSKETREYIEENKADLLKNLEGLNLLLAQKIAAVKVDHQNLEKAFRHFTEILSVHERTSNEVVLSGSILLIKQMEKLYEGIQSSNIKILIERKQWADFHRILDMIQSDIDKLGDRAKRYSAGGQQTPYENTDLEMSEEQAYKVLGLSPSATNEQIKKVYWQLSHIYHPDKGLSQDDERFKLIKAAFLALKEKRKFS